MASQRLITGTLFDIQGFSVHDGPGCRTLIFLKGCLLRCSWCSNPEGLNPFAEPLYNSSQCIFDNLCLDACREKAIVPGENTLHFNREKCRDCPSYECAAACCTGAIKTGGYDISLEELIKKINRDRQYWGANGGITLTGGEPFLQPHFTKELVKRCHEAFIHTAIETCGNVPWSNIENGLEYLDWIFYDLKQMDSIAHREMTGAGNELILENARKLAGTFQGKLVFRMPVIPGYNDSEEHIRQIAGFMNSVGRCEINILPLHHFGREKYRLIDRAYYTQDFKSPQYDSLLRIKFNLKEQGIDCYIGTETPF